MPENEKKNNIKKNNIKKNNITNFLKNISITKKNILNNEKRSINYNLKKPLTYKYKNYLKSKSLGDYEHVKQINIEFIDAINKKQNASLEIYFFTNTDTNAKITRGLSFFILDNIFYAGLIDFSDDHIIINYVSRSKKINMILYYNNNTDSFFGNYTAEEENDNTITMIVGNYVTPNEKVIDKFYRL